MKEKHMHCGWAQETRGRERERETKTVQFEFCCPWACFLSFSVVHYSTPLWPPSLNFLCAYGKTAKGLTLTGFDLIFLVGLSQPILLVIWSLYWVDYRVGFKNYDFFVKLVANYLLMFVVKINSMVLILCGLVLCINVVIIVGYFLTYLNYNDVWLP